MKATKKYGNLHNAPYEKNIDEIWKILELFPKSCRKLFLKNLKTLIIENIPKKELEMIAEDGAAEGIYIPDCNTIYLNKTTKYKHAILNHELIHATSSSENRRGIIGTFELGPNIISIGNNLEEGITEYLALKSVNKEKTHTGYHIEVFVIKCLTDIYGDKILIPYFKKKEENFYKQFNRYREIIIKIDLLLKRLSNYIDITDIFEEYLLLKELNPKVLKENNLYIESTEIHILAKHLINNQKIINKLYEKEEKTNKKIIPNEPYEIIKPENIDIYKEWYKKEKDLLNEIIKRIIILGRINKLSDQLIKEIIVNNLKHSDETLEVIKYHNKKLIRK